MKENETSTKNSGLTQTLKGYEGLGNTSRSDSFMAASPVVLFYNGKSNVQKETYKEPQQDVSLSSTLGAFAKSVGKKAGTAFKEMAETFAPLAGVPVKKPGKEL